jgi:hypothetical protein
MHLLSAAAAGLASGNPGDWEALCQRIRGSTAPTPVPAPPPAPVPSYRPQGINKPPDFSGDRSKGSLRVNEFVFRAKKYVMFMHPPLAGTNPSAEDHWRGIEIMASYLKGAAFEWWQSRHDHHGTHGFSTVKLFCDALAATFSSPTDENRVRDRLLECSQTGSVLKYCQITNSLLNELSSLTNSLPDSVDLAHRFIAGLKDPQVRFHLRRTPPSSLEEAMAEALRLDDAVSTSSRFSAGSDAPFQSKRQANNRQRFSKNPPAHSGPAPMELGAVHTSGLTPAETARLKALQTKLKDTGRFPKLAGDADWDILKKAGACGYCRHVGHVANDCPEKHQGGANSSQAKAKV